MRRLVRADCIDVGSHLDERVDLVIGDPPYASMRDWGAFSDEWREPDRDEYASLPRPLRRLVDLASTTHSLPMAAYVTFMATRTLAIRAVLAPGWSLYCFCDDAASGHLRVLLDAVLGRRRFCNTLIWRRSVANNLPSAKWKRDVDHVHYYRDRGATWNQPWVPHDPEYVEKHYKPVNELLGGVDERRAANVLALMPVQLNGEISAVRQEERRAASTKSSKSATLDRPRTVRNTEPFLGVRPPPGRAWRWKRETMERLHAEGRLFVSPTGKALRYIRYLDETPGQRHGSIFLDDAPPSAREYLDYPTQKPMSLIRRLIEASSDPGDLVLDPFCGSGTTLAVAEQLGRRWIGFDVGDAALAVAVPRLEAECHTLLGGSVEVVVR